MAAEKYGIRSPIPKATVAQTMWTSVSVLARWMSLRSYGSMLPWSVRRFVPKVLQTQTQYKYCKCCKRCKHCTHCPLNSSTHCCSEPTS